MSPDLVRAYITAHPLLSVALAGLWGAVAIDLMEFVRSKDPGDWLSQFNVKKALLRYLQSTLGNLIGTIAVAGGTAAVAVWWLW